MSFYISSAILFIVAGFLATVITLIFLKKIKIGGPFSVYALIVLLPVILIAIPLILIVSIFSFAILFTPLIVIPIWLIAIEIYILSITIIVKANVFPSSSFDESTEQNKNLICLGKGKRLLNYSLFGNLLYFIPNVLLTSLTVYMLFTGASGLIEKPAEAVEFLAALFIWSVLLAHVTTIAISIIMCIYISVLIINCIFLITSINGVVRLALTSKRIKSVSVLYVFLMLVPIVNIISIIVIGNIVKKEIKAKLPKEIPDEQE